MLVNALYLSLNLWTETLLQEIQIHLNSQDVWIIEIEFIGLIFTESRMDCSWDKEFARFNWSLRYSNNPNMPLFLIQICVVLWRQDYLVSPEAVVRRCSVIKFFLKISQRPATLLKRESNTSVFQRATASVSRFCHGLSGELVY